MITDIPGGRPISEEPPRAATSLPVSESPSYDERWAAWQAKGAADDRAFRRTMAVAVPVLLVVAAVVIYAVLGR